MKLYFLNFLEDEWFCNIFPGIALNKTKEGFCVWFDWLFWSIGIKLK